MDGKRLDGRANNQVRPVSIQYDAFGYADASIFFSQGQTKVLVSVTLKQGVPQFLKGSGKGWLTAEYAMLPCATTDRTMREAQQNQRNSRSVEISRLIGRCLRSVVNLDCLGERTITIDCDVLQADGSTRVACITAASRVLELAYRRWLSAGIVPGIFFKEAIAAISVGQVAGQACVDLAYSEDSAAAADFNFIFTQRGGIVEIQGTAEATPLEENEFEQLRLIARQGVQSLFGMCEEFPFPEGFGNKVAFGGNQKKQQARQPQSDQHISNAQRNQGAFFSLAQRINK